MPKLSAIFFIFIKIKALIWCGAYIFPLAPFTNASPLIAQTIPNDTRFLNKTNHKGDMECVIYLSQQYSIDYNDLLET